jgi:hypothetical protein
MNPVGEARQRARRARLLMSLDRGTVVTAKGSRYRVLRIRDNGEINCWGPLGKHAGTYTFRWTDITKVHEKEPRRDKSSTTANQNNVGGGG